MIESNVKPGVGKTPDSIRRKLRSHTRQQQSSGALSPSNTTSATSNSSADFVEVNQEDGEEVRKDGDEVPPVDETVLVNVVAGTRKRKVRQQQQSENSNDASLQAVVVVATAAAVAVCSTIELQQRAFYNTNNCIKQFIEIRNEIVKRREVLKKVNVEPKLPMNYEDFCLVKKNYLIKDNKEAFFLFLL